MFRNGVTMSRNKKSSFLLDYRFIISFYSFADVTWTTVSSLLKDFGSQNCPLRNCYITCWITHTSILQRLFHDVMSGTYYFRKKTNRRP